MYLFVFSLVCLGLVLSDILLSNKSGHIFPLVAVSGLELYLFC